MTKAAPKAAGGTGADLEDVLRLGQERLELLGLSVNVRDGRPGLDQRAVAQHLRLDLHAQPVVHGIEARLRQLEPVEVARDGEILGLPRAPLPVRVEALREEAQAGGERGVALGGQRLGLGAQKGEQGRRIGTVTASSSRGLRIAMLARSGRPSALPGIPERHPALPIRLRRAEPGHVKGQRPALVLGERAKAPMAVPSTPSVMVL